MNYGENISGAFWISLRNPYLWFFGFFLGGSGYSVNFSGQDQDFGPSQDLLRFLENNLVTLAVVGVVFAVVLTVVFITLGIISRAGLVASVAALRDGRSSGFFSAWRAGVSKFWRVLGLQISFFLISVLLFFIAAIPAGLAILLIVTVSDSVGLVIASIVLVSLLALAVLFLLFVPLYIIGALAARTLVLDDRGVFDSIGEGFQLFRNNIGKSVLVWLIQIGYS